MKEEQYRLPMSSLPEEIIVEEILWRLPIKPLIRFRSVCKSWNSLIASDSHFALLQLKNSLKTSSNSNSDRQRILLWNSSSTFFLEKNPLTNSFTVEKLNSCPIKGSSFLVVASCDGLVCLREQSSNVLLFWNSLTGETKRVPEPLAQSPCPFFTYGLGYDPSTDDYKLVRIFRFDTEIPNRVYPKEVRVYSLRTDSWKQIQDFPYVICTLDAVGKHSHGVSLNGAIYWTVYHRNSANAWFQVVSFDLAKEEYRLLEISDPARMLYSFIRVAVLNEKLCVYYPLDCKTYRLWLIVDYDNGESWTKYTITVPDGLPTPVCLLKNGEEVLLAVEEDRLGVYHLKDHTFRQLQIPGMPKTFRTMTFAETLISPNGYEGINS